MLYITVSLKSTQSCGTTPIAPRTLAWLQRRMSCPSMAMAPDCGS
jgi:hypothetical protein